MPTFPYMSPCNLHPIKPLPLIFSNPTELLPTSRILHRPPSLSSLLGELLFIHKTPLRQKIAFVVFLVGYGEKWGSVHRQWWSSRGGTEAWCVRWGHTPLVATWKPHALRHEFPKTNLHEPQFPRLYNFKVSIINYQQILIECLLHTRPALPVPGI